MQTEGTTTGAHEDGRESPTSTEQQNFPQFEVRKIYFNDVLLPSVDSTLLETVALRRNQPAKFQAELRRELEAKLSRMEYKAIDTPVNLVPCEFSSVLSEAKDTIASLAALTGDKITQLQQIEKSLKDLRGLQSLLEVQYNNE